MTLHRHSSQVFSLGTCVDDTTIETDLKCKNQERSSSHARSFKRSEV